MNQFAMNYIHTNKEDIQRIYQVMLTGGCNLRCKYCYENFENGYMTKETSERVVDKILELEDFTKRDDGFYIQFFGGEAFLNIDVMSHMADYLIKENNGKHKIRLHVATNGTLFNQKISDFILKYNDILNITISIDGKKDIHDSQRSGYDKIVENIPKFKQVLHSNQLKLSATMTPNTVSHLYETVVHFVEDLGVKNIKYNTEINNRRFLDDDMTDIFTDQIMKCADYIINNNSIKIGNLHYNNFRKLDTGYICKALTQNMTIDWNGNIMGCSFFRNEDTSQSYDVFRFKDILADASEIIDCQNGCKDNALNSSNSIKNFSECNECEINSGCKKCPTSLTQTNNGLYGIPFHCRFHKAEFKAFMYMTKLIPKKS